MKFTILKRVDAYKAITAIQEAVEKPEFKGLEVRIEEVKQAKTLQQIKYIHDIISDYLTAVLFEYGNIEANSIELAKIWLKEYCGYGDLNNSNLRE